MQQDIRDSKPPKLYTGLSEAVLEWSDPTPEQLYKLLFQGETPHRGPLFSLHVCVQE